MNTTHRETDKAYYYGVIKTTFQPGENLENYEQVLLEYKEAYDTRKQGMADLAVELKTIKKLKV